MSRPTPKPIAEFLSGRRIAVAGVSRAGNQPANAIFKTLRKSGYDAIPVNPKATEIDGVSCYPDVKSIPGAIDGVMVVTHPSVSEEIARQASERGVHHVWFHRSFGDGSVSQAALDACAARGIQPIVGGCPMMYCEPVDIPHRCIRWWLGVKGELPH